MSDHAPVVFLWWGLVVAALVVAIGVGEHTQRQRRAGQVDADFDHLHGGFKLDLLAGASLTLAVVMCSFMLAISYSDFDDANRQASSEAGAVSASYETAGTVAVEQDARRLQQDTICYGRAVVSDEWPTLRESGSISPGVERWRVRQVADLRAVAAGGSDVPGLSALLQAQQQVAVTHQARLLSANRKTPWYLFLLLIAVCAAAIYFVSAFTVRAIPPRLRRRVVAVLTVLLAGTLAVIIDLAHPYRGVSNVGPEYMASVNQENAANYRQLWNGAEVTLCDADGMLR